jgi:hypothetical protein
MSGFEAFLTGFLGRTAEKIDERKDKANDYFDQAIERARTIGADGLRQRTDNYQSMLSVANNLVQQAGMPEDLVRAIANDGPGALEQAYQIYQTNAEANKPVDEEFWRNVYDFSTEVTSGSNMSIEDFLKQVNGLYGSNLAATEQEGGDPFGAFIASGLGLNAMERAQGQLGEYDMGGGYSAADLLAMDARPSTTRPMGDTGFGGPDLAYAIPQGGEQPLTPEERMRIYDRFDESVEEETDRLFADYMSGVAENDGQAEMTREDFAQQAKENLAIDYLERFGPDFIRQFPELIEYLPMEDEEAPADTEVTTTELPPPSDTPAPVVDEPATPEVDVPSAPEPVGSGATAYQPPPEGVVFNIPSTQESVRYMGSDEAGNMIFRINEDQEVVLSPEEYETAIQSGEIAVGVSTDIIPQPFYATPEYLEQTN